VIEVASAIAIHSMPKDQVLRAGRRPNRICLNEPHAFDRGL
jgi:hypothetical protein